MTVLMVCCRTTCGLATMLKVGSYFSSVGMDFLRLVVPALLLSVARVVPLYNVHVYVSSYRQPSLSRMYHFGYRVYNGNINRTPRSDTNPDKLLWSMQQPLKNTGM